MADDLVERVADAIDVVPSQLDVREQRRAEARAAIAECFKRRPIEEAPKDGRSFLACSGNWITVCHWHKYQMCWATSGPVYSRYPCDEQPTHWIPLPDPPKEFAP